jgi:ABC-type siderophore export system fused ATPase/permease subunit
MATESGTRFSLAESDIRAYNLTLIRLAWGSVTSVLFLGACFYLIYLGHDIVGCLLAIVYILASMVARVGGK